RFTKKNISSIQWRFLQFSDEARRWLNLRKETSCYGLAPVVFRSISHFKRLFSQMPPAISSRVLNVFGVDYKSHLYIRRLALLQIVGGDKLIIPFC
ncbi:hypothetical protein SNA20_00655, partial [Escherichia coli]|nr:hypothetical protein [Escherichia coli]